MTSSGLHGGWPAGLSFHRALSPLVPQCRRLQHNLVPCSVIYSTFSFNLTCIFYLNMYFIFYFLCIF